MLNDLPQLFRFYIYFRIASSQRWFASEVRFFVCTFSVGVTSFGCRSFIRFFSLFISQQQQCHVILLVLLLLLLLMLLRRMMMSLVRLVHLAHTSKFQKLGCSSFGKPRNTVLYVRQSTESIAEQEVIYRWIHIVLSSLLFGTTR